MLWPILDTAEDTPPPLIWTLPPVAWDTFWSHADWSWCDAAIVLFASLLIICRTPRFTKPSSAKRSIKLTKKMLRHNNLGLYDDGLLNHKKKEIQILRTIFKSQWLLKKDLLFLLKSSIVVKADNDREKTENRKLKAQETPLLLRLRWSEYSPFCQSE